MCVFLEWGLEYSPFHVLHSEKLTWPSVVAYDFMLFWKLIWWFSEEGEFQAGYRNAFDTSLHCVLLLSVSDLSCVAVYNVSQEMMLLLVVALHHQISCLTHVTPSVLERTEFPEMNTHCNVTCLKPCGTGLERPTLVITFNLCWILLKSIYLCQVTFIYIIYYINCFKAALQCIDR